MAAACEFNTNPGAGPYIVKAVAARGNAAASSAAGLEGLLIVNLCRTENTSTSISRLGKSPGKACCSGAAWQDIACFVPLHGTDPHSLPIVLPPPWLPVVITDAFATPAETTK